MNKPKVGQYSTHYQTYINDSPDGDIIEYLGKQPAQLKSFFAGIPEEKFSFRYAPGKWSVKEILGHIIETERVFAYRALRFSKKDKTPLQSFDENEFIRNSDYDRARINSLLEEFDLVRRSNILMFKNFPDDAWKFSGISGGKELILSAIPFIMAGHCNHHIDIIKERYLK